MVKENFSYKLRKLRKNRNLTPIEVSKMLEISPERYRNWENGTRQPKIEMLKRISEIYDVSIDYLLGKSTNKQLELAYPKHIPSKNDLVSRIKYIASEKKGWSLKETALKAGMGENSIYRWKKQEPNLQSLQKIANILEINLDELMDITPLPVRHIDLKNPNEKISLFYDGKKISQDDLNIIKAILERHSK